MLSQLFLQELTADRYVECSGAFSESSFSGDWTSLDPRALLVEAQGPRLVYRARACLQLLPREQGQVCGACRELGAGQELEQEQEEQEEEEEEGLGSLEQYLEVSMEDGQESEQRPEMVYQEVKPRTNMEILRHGLDSNPLQAMKPKISYKKLISMAIKDSHFKMLKLTDIYGWILERYPGFNANRTGFQNSVRHNLSLNKVFIKVNLPGVANNGKGNYWAINPRFEDSTNSVPDPRQQHPDPLRESGHSYHSPAVLAVRSAQFAANRPDLNVTCKSVPAIMNGVKTEPEDNGWEREEEAEAKALLYDNPNISITLQPRAASGLVLPPSPAPAVREGAGHDFSDGLVLDKPNFR